MIAAYQLAIHAKKRVGTQSNASSRTKKITSAYVRIVAYLNFTSMAYVEPTILGDHALCTDPYVLPAKEVSASIDIGPFSDSGTL